MLNKYFSIFCIEITIKICNKHKNITVPPQPSQFSDIGMTAANGGTFHCPLASFEKEFSVSGPRCVKQAP